LVDVVVEVARSAGAGDSPPAACVVAFVNRNRGGGKVENLLWVFHFPIRPRRRSCGNVGISPAFGEISKGLVERGESLLLAFYAFHSPGISTALSSFVDSGRTLQERDRHYGMPELLKKFGNRGGACRPHLGSVWSGALAAARPVARACLARLPFLQSCRSVRVPVTDPRSCLGFPV